MIAAETEHRRASWRPESLHFHAGDAVVLPLRIVIEPTAKGGKWIARLDGRVLCVATAPLIKSARVLLSEGYPPYAVIEMWRPNTNEWALRGRIGPVVATLLAGETAASVAKNGSPVREKGSDGREGAIEGETLLHGPFLAACRLNKRVPTGEGIED
jgi:hypothetical protein